MLRSANKTQHLQQNPGHNIVKVNDKSEYDTFPPEVSAFIEGEGRVYSKVFGIMKGFRPVQNRPARYTCAWVR